MGRQRTVQLHAAITTEFGLFEAELKRQEKEHDQIRSDLLFKPTAERRDIETYAGEIRFFVWYDKGMQRKKGRRLYRP